MQMIRRLLTAAAVTVMIFSWVAIMDAAQQRLPYSAIDHPQFVPASQATFLSPNDFLLGIMDGKVAKAYPAAILAQHGIVQDQTAEGPIAVTW